jgi:MFS family permease
MPTEIGDSILPPTFPAWDSTGTASWGGCSLMRGRSFAHVCMTRMAALMVTLLTVIYAAA